MMPRALVLDIETAPFLCHTWGVGEQIISLEQLHTDWSIMAYCGIWLDEPKKPIYADTGGRGPKKVRDDRALLKGLYDLLDEADIVIGQNHRRFDIKRINARLLLNGYKPYSPIRLIDTFEVAKSTFGFPSNKLQYMSSVATDTPKLSHKKFPGWELWLECLKDNPEAWREMRRYNIRDVQATAQLYEEFRPWIKQHPNHGAYLQDKNPRCTNCGSDKLQARGHAITQQGSYARYQCQACGAWCRGKVTEIERKTRKTMLASIA